MIGMGMGDIEVMDVFPSDGGILQLTENTVSASGIHEQHVTLGVAEDKTGVVTSRDRGVAGSEYDHFM
jgi:hypothetical protein